MRFNDRQYGKPELVYADTMANLEALADPQEGWVAYATDQHCFVVYENNGWCRLYRITVGTSQPSSPNTGDLWVDTN